ncbi:MAG: hypothetical protein HY454_03080 [Parcubacteria group bacterium]|nr:hypothetical protein [Parcubacteria group bacterium]
MTPITIPRELSRQGDLVIIPRTEYEEFSQWKETIKSSKTYIPTVAEKRILKKAREDYKKGKYMSFYELKQKLGIKK